jgi:hypothetical protein
MTAFADLSEVVNRASGGNSGTPEFPLIWIDGRIQAAAAATPVAGRMSSLWQYNKSNGANGAAPGAVRIPTRATLGALGQTNPGGGRQRWLTMLDALFSVTGSVIAYDRLLDISGLSGTVTTAQTVGGTITRNTGGVGNQIWAEIYTQIGATGTTITASYTNQAGTASRTTKAATFGATNAREAQRILVLPLQDGDTGVQSIQNCTVLATTGTAGDFGITMAYPYGNVPACLGVSNPRDFLTQQPPLPEIVTDACVAFVWLANSATIPAGYLQVGSMER